MQIERPILASALALSLLSACSGGNSTPSVPGANMPMSQSVGSSASSVAAALPGGVMPHAVTPGSGLTVTLFARGNAKLFNPDPIVAVGGYTYVAFQNATTATGGGGFSTIAQYDAPNHIKKSIHVTGRCDGMRYNPYTHEMWITVNEDANSSLYTWNIDSGALKHFAFSAATHGGGYDDLAFANGKAFIAASNPTLNSDGINTHPALVSVTLVGSTAVVKPALLGDEDARDITSGQIVKLNLTDPDSMQVAPNGDVILVSQADSEVIFIHNAGLPLQTVSRLSVGTQLDDIDWARQPDGILYVVDAHANAIYIVKNNKFTTGTIYTQAPSDSGVAGFVGTVDPHTGTITPVIIGFQSPTGLIFVSAR